VELIPLSPLIGIGTNCGCGPLPPASFSNVSTIQFSISITLSIVHAGLGEFPKVSP